jgi:hypothetical protein
MGQHLAAGDQRLRHQLAAIRAAGVLGRVRSEERELIDTLEIQDRQQLLEVTGQHCPSQGVCLAEPARN